MLPRGPSSRERFRAYLERRAERARAAKKDQPSDPAVLSPPPDAFEAAAERKQNKLKRSRTFFVLFKEFWRLLRGHQRTCVLALGTLSVSSLVGLIAPASTKAAIDYILTDSPGPSGIPPWIREAFSLPQSREALLWRLGFALVIVALVTVAFSMWGRFQMTRLTKRVQVRLRRMAFDHAVQLPLHRIHAHRSGGVSSLLRQDAGEAGNLLFSMIYNPWRAIVQLLGTLVVLAWVDWRMLVGALALIPAVWLSHKTWIARIRPVFRDIGAQRQAIDASTTEAFGGMRVVRGFGQSRAESTRFTRAQHFMARQEMLVWWWSRVVDIAWAVLIPLASAAVLVYGGTQVVRGNMTIGDIMMFSTYLLMLLGPLETLSSTATNIQTNLAGLDRVLDLLAEPRETEALGKVDDEDRIPVDRSRSRGEIEFREVWFAYPKTPDKVQGVSAAPTSDVGEDVIRGVSLVAKPGETVALVGPSGSGKTTLCNLVARFFDPTQGQVLFDGVDLRAIDITSFRRLLGIVEQDVFLFDGTVAENIAYGDRRATPEMIRQAAEAANAHAFIEAMERGYDTLIGERGVRLSGGQKQRLAIARALVVDPLILILDEATSNLDAESEALIQKSLARIMRGRTSFVIAHRLSTVRNADRIVVLEKGVVVETGRHEDLLARQGRYAELLRTQIESHSAGAIEI